MMINKTGSLLLSVVVVCLFIIHTASALQLPFNINEESQNAYYNNLQQESSLIKARPPSSDTLQRVYLSHSGLYFGSPLSRGAQPHISLYVDVPLYSLEGIRISVSQIQKRNWEEVHLKCGSYEGGTIEECEKQDKEEAEELAKGGDIDNNKSIACKASSIIHEQSRILIDGESCPPLASILSRESDALENAKESILESLVITFDVQRLVPVKKERHHYWLGSLRRVEGPGPDGGALWPFAGTAHSGNDSTSVKYTGLVPNRISGLMQDPYFPRTAKPDSFDPLNGVDLTFASWSYGISIRVPHNGESQEDMPRFEPVHSPVSGQVIWKGEYTIQRAPGNHRNDEVGLGVMIRDEWGTVYQLLGLYEEAMKVELGQSVSAGQVVGGATRTPLSLEPPCRHKPSDPPKMDDDSRRYPYRWRNLHVMVARPGPSWTEWKAPFERGWQYFNPLDAFTLAGRTSSITPDPNPSQMFFADPSEDGALTPPNIVATSKDLIQPPTLSSEAEVIVAFDSFIDTPGDEGDQLDLISLHALDWAIVPVSSSSVGGSAANPHDMFNCENIPADTIWRNSFDHTKLPNAWTVSLPKTALLAHYVPAFTVGSVPWFKTKYASQFDEKGRKLFYAPTRILVGQTDGRGAWDTRKEPDGNGLYQVWVRGRDWFGNSGCIGANIRIRNGG